MAIIVKVFKNQKALTFDGITNRKEQCKDEITRTLTIVIITFLVTHLVHSIYEIKNLVGFGEQGQRTVFGTAVVILLVTNSSINFIIYSVLGTKFRKEFLDIIRCKSEDLEDQEQQKHKDSLILDYTSYF